MMSGGEYEEVGRWLWNFVISHAKRENPRAEAIVEPRVRGRGRAYGIRLSLGDRLAPPPDGRRSSSPSRRSPGSAAA